MLSNGTAVASRGLVARLALGATLAFGATALGAETPAPDPVPTGDTVLSGASVPAPVPAAAGPGDARRGAQFAHTCYGCHGIPDHRNPYPAFHVPKIGGQQEVYIVAALTEYRTGARPHPTMRGQAIAMTDQEIRDVAAYFATRNPVKSDGQPTGTAPAAAPACIACHGQDGVGILPEYPTLSGQHRDYLEHALRAYRRGERQNAIMQGFAAGLRDEDIRALADYYSRQSPALWTPRPPRAPDRRGTPALNPKVPAAAR